jgi:hypothetical protein
MLAAMTPAIRPNDGMSRKNLGKYRKKKGVKEV